MINALAPGMRRGWSWVWLSIALAGGLPPSIFAQAGKKAEPAARKGEAAASKKAADEDADEDEPETEKGGKVEIFKDPKAEEALKVFKSLGFKALRENDRKAVLKRMAPGEDPADRETIRRFVQGEANELVDKTNIMALIDPPLQLNPNSHAARAVQLATDDLLDAHHTARVNKNTEFLNTYHDVLIEVLPRLLDNNLIARVQAMIVLGQTGSPKAVPIFVSQIRNKDQTLWVKLWALRGLSQVVEGGVKVDSIGAQATDAGKAISEFLDNEPDVPWPLQFRALAALGAMRQASVPNDLQRARMASTAMRYLADSRAVYHPEVRAEAAWALGMVRVNPAVKKYNYALIAYHAGEVAVDLGEQVSESVVVNAELAQYLTGLLLTPIYQAFNGLDGARESGLLKVGTGNPDLAYTRQVADLSTAVTKASIELVRAPRGQVLNLAKVLDERVAKLKAFLDKNPPKGYKLVPDGPEFRPPPPQVADKPKVEKPVDNAADKPKVAGAGVRGGR